MNLKSNKARASIAALGACTLVVGGGWLSSAMAAPTPLTLNSGGDNFVIANLGHASAQAAATEYAQKLTGADANVKLDLITAPFGGQLFYDKVATNGVATTNPSTVNFKSDEVQTVTTAGTPTGGSFTLTYDGQTTAAIAYNASSATVQTALENLSNIAVGDVTVSGTTGPDTTYTVTFGGTLADTDVPALTYTSSLTGGAPTITIATTTAGGTDTSISSAITQPVATDYLYIGANVPGTYTFRYFQDTNGNSQLDADDERASSVVTATVVDALGTSTSTGDDVSPVITSTSPISVGQAVNATFAYSKGLTLADARGSGVSPSLKQALAARTFVDVSSDAGDTTTVNGISNATDSAATYTAATNTTSFAVGTPGEAGSISLRADLKAASGGSDGPTGGTKTVSVESNGVTTVANAVTLVDDKVIAPSSSTATVKSGTASVTYTATAVNTTPNPDVNVANATVYFTLGGANVSTLTTNGTTVDAANHVFSATTNSNGVASLTVTTSAPTAGTTYTVSPSTNGATVTPATITTTYADAAATTIDNTNTAAELTPETTQASVTLKGKVLDQFGAAYQPPSSASQQVGIQIPDGNAVGNAVITNGAFTYVYTPASTPSAGDTTTFDFTYGSLSDGNTEGGTIRWASTAAASSITISAPADAATGVDLETFGNAPSGIAVSGTVLDSTNGGLAYKSVVLSGSDGVWFAEQASPDATHPLSKTLTAVTNSSGAIQNAYVFFTKAGTATVKATSGSATKTVTVTTDASEDSFKVIAIDTKGKPGTTIAITGKINDAFGNPVVGRRVNLSLSDASVGVLANTNPATDSNGVWSTTISPAANQSGEVTLTAVLRNVANNANLVASDVVPVTAWKTAGVDLGTGEIQDQAKITVGDTDLTISSSGQLTYGSKYYARGALISGTADAGDTVSIYGKTTSTNYELMDTATADENGEFGTVIKIKKSTWFIAKVGDATSKSSLTKVYSAVTLEATSSKADKVTLSANGGPNVKGVITFYRVYADGSTKKLGSSFYSNSGGNGSKTFSAPSGNRKYKVVFQAPGTYSGSDTDTVKVK